MTLSLAPYQIGYSLRWRRYWGLPKTKNKYVDMTCWYGSRSSVCIRNLSGHSGQRDHPPETPQFTSPVGIPDPRHVPTTLLCLCYRLLLHGYWSLQN